MVDAGVVDVVVAVVVVQMGCDEDADVVVAVEPVVRVQLEVVVEVEGAGGPIWGTIWSLTDFSMAPKGSILLTDSLSWDRGPPPLVKSGELKSNWEVDLDIPEPLLPLLLMFIIFIIEPLLMLFMSGGTYGLMDCPISMLLIVGRVILPGDIALFHRFIHVSESSSLTPGVPGIPEELVALQEAEESIVTSSTGELARVVIIPHMY